MCKAFFFFDDFALDDDCMIFPLAQLKEKKGRGNEKVGQPILQKQANSSLAFC